MQPRFHIAHKILIVFGLMAPALTFLLAVSDLSMGQKTIGLLAISAIYAVICGWAYYRFLQHETAAETEIRSAPGNETNAADPLAALENTGMFFGSSLKQADMFRFVSGRIREIVPIWASLLLMPDEQSKTLTVMQMDGSLNADDVETKSDIGVGIAGMAFLSGEIELDDDLSVEKASQRFRDTGDARSSAAIPLKHEGIVFGVMQLLFETRIEDHSEIKTTLEAIAESISPLFLSSQTLERSLSTALTDPLTDLPNERAFYMVLENQVAESQRFSKDRPLSVLVADIKGFDEANQRYGHSTGDELLRFAGETIRKSLRKMDFLSRVSNDEFAVILPTADEETAREVIERIKTNFAATPFQISEHESTKLWLYFGVASFIKDCESAEELVQAARSDKQNVKSEEPASILFIEKEYLN